jgi:outer membrane biosynthesis protein TonB
MRTGLAISGTGHAAVLLWSVLTFAGTHLPDHPDLMPVDVISDADFSKLTNGAKTAPKAEQPKPVADKVGEATPVEDPTAAPAKKEVKASADVPPVPSPKPPQPKPPQPKPKTATPSDPIAEAIKKNDDKQRPDPKPAEAKAPPAPAKKPSEPQFDPRNIAELLNKQTPQRVAAAGPEVNAKVTLGVAGGTANQLSQYELDALKARLTQLWNPPAGARDARDLSFVISVKFKPDGTVDGRPRLVTAGSGPLFAAASEAAVRAILLGQPFTMLKPEHYEEWGEMEITFDHDMAVRG